MEAGLTVKPELDADQHPVWSGVIDMRQTCPREQRDTLNLDLFLEQLQVKDSYLI